MNGNLQHPACLWNAARGPRPRRRTLRLLLAGFLILPFRFAVLGVDPDGAVIKTDQAVGKPATTAYAQQIGKLINASWTRSIEQNDDAPFGAVVVRLYVDKQGGVIQPHIVSGPPKEILHRLALLAVMKTPLPAMPDDAVKELQGRHLVLDLTFDYTSEPTPSRKHRSR